ncbi:MAPEG family protein [Marinimicrobium sp. ABcell2]|uniref:MAPEG family protein n=1 Tax=Marinimicrobium sp. ABcell2 TaxID=3069751 RepID=UPI0027ADD456|nr:MAPEG family protein [Marinimicrobium sp. ABcell2]MDQ2077963.1 MAPEG family protein [Marinimicrobium sp. ABcell2]
MLYPMLSLMALTFLVSVYLLTLRVLAVRRREVSIGYFRVYAGAEPPARMAAASRHYSNLFEVPLIFYIACITALVLGAQSGTLLGLAWAYVLTRLAHSVIHLSYNNVMHRLAAFLLSNLLLLAIWVILARHYAAG